MAYINACKYHEHFENGVTDAFFSKSVSFAFFAQNGSGNAMQT